MEKKLPEGSWDIVSYRLAGDWKPTTGGPTLEIEGDRLSGNAGVNRVMSSGTELPLGPVATTMMAGPPELMDQEQRLLALIAEADAVVHGLSGMFLLRDGLTVLELRRTGTEQSP